MGPLVKLLLKRLRALLEETGGIRVVITPLTDEAPLRRLTPGRKALSYIT